MAPRRDHAITASATESVDGTAYYEEGRMGLTPRRRARLSFALGVDMLLLALVHPEAPPE